jgi:hypothetical protein
MWVKSHSNVYKGVRKEDIWRLWADINNYTQWHDDLDYCKLDGEFAVGNYFMLKPKGAPAVKIEIIELIENRKFTDCTYFWGAKMYDIHELEETQDGLRITSTIQVTGILTYLWVQLVAKNVAKSASNEMEALVKLARVSHD